MSAAEGNAGIGAGTNRADEITPVVDALFRYADPDTFVALRCFPQHDKGQPAEWLVDVRAGDLPALVAAIGRGIHRAAMATEPEVFSPVTGATFRTPGTAKTRDIANGLAIAVEIDSGNTAAALAGLEALLGPATLVVRSGGTWADPDTGEVFDKLHAYWRLSEPTRDEPEHVLLYAARRNAAILAGADMSGVPVAHCFRFPGSLNRKDPERPALCRARVNGDAEVHLVDAAEALALAVEGAGLGKGNGRGNGNGAYQGRRELQADPALVAAAMAVIPNADVHYADWVRMAYAVAGATGGTGADIFSAWSAKSVKHNDAETKTLWDRVLAAKPTKIGAGSIFHEARLHGWVDPRQGSKRTPRAGRTAAQGAAGGSGGDGPTPGAGASQTPDTGTPGTGGDGNGRVPPPGGQGTGDGSDGEDGPGPEWIEGPEELDDASRPTITVVKGLLHRLADEAEQAVIDSGVPVYHRGVLVRPAITELDAADGGKTHVAALRPLGVPAMLDLFCRTARWQKWNGTAKRYVPTDPPEMVAKILIAREGQWRVPQLRGILSTPTLRRDGSLLRQPGYDEQSRYYLALPSDLHVPPISDEPDRSEALAAIRLMEARLADFPWIDDGGASKSVGLSLMMTAVIRAALTVAPIHAATAPAAGTGKSYLYDTAAAIAFGDRCPVIFAGKSPEELEKKLNGILLRGATLFNLDNLNIPLEGDLLCQIATQPLLELRRLGKSDTFLTPNSALGGATGNNMAVHDDLNRRTLMAGMDRKVERPELHDFKGANPFQTIMRARGEYVAAVLTAVRAYLCDPMGVTVSPLASFENYTHFVREPLVWLGYADPARTMDALAAADPKKSQLHNVMSAWEATVGIGKDATAAEIARNVETPPMPKRADHPGITSSTDWQAFCEGVKANWQALGDALEATSTQRSGKMTPGQIGAWLRSKRHTVVNRKRFTSRVVHGGAHAWTLVESAEAEQSE